MTVADLMKIWLLWECIIPLAVIAVLGGLCLLFKALDRIGGRK